MAGETTTSTDAGKLIVPFASNVLALIASNNVVINNAAAAAGVSALSIAGNIARELNKTEAGDYSYYYFGPIFHTFANLAAITGNATGASGMPLTQEGYLSDLADVRQNEISNTQSAGISGWIARAGHAVLNDVGVAKIQIGTAMEAVQYYVNNQSLFSGDLNLSQYANDTPKLVYDLMNSSTSLQVSISLQAVIARQAYDWASGRVAGWT